MGNIFELGILVGRFQVLHAGHEMMIDRAIELCKEVAVFIGSSQESRTNKNPLSYEERESVLGAVYGEKIKIYPLPDIGVGNNSKWGEYVIKNVIEKTGRRPDVLISGEEARRNAWFDDLGVVFIPKSIDISSTMMREWLVSGDIESWKAYTNPKLHGMYDTIRNAVLMSKDNTETKSL